MKVNNKDYDRLKNISTLVIPGFITMVGVIGGALGWEYNDVTQTILGAIGVFIGVIVKALSVQYSKEGEDSNE